MLVASQAGWAFDLLHPTGVAEGNPVGQVVLSAGFLAVGLLLLRRWRKALDAVLASPILWVLLLLAALSLVWTSEPGAALRRLVVLEGVSLTGLYLVVSFKPGDIPVLIAWSLAAAAAASLLLTWLDPSAGLFPETRAGHAVTLLKGVCSHPNVLGELMAAQVVTCAVLVGSLRGRGRLAAIAGLVTGGVVLAATGSRTAWIACGAVLVVWLVRQVWLLLTRRTPAAGVRRRRTPWIRVALACAPLVLVAAFLWVTLAGVAGFGATTTTATGPGDSSGLARLLEVIGRSPTFTGRTTLWRLTWEKILERPWLGWGYAGFWQPGQAGAEAIWQTLWWQPLHAHSGYLDLLLALGLVGAVLFSGLVVWGFSRTLSAATADKSPLGFYPLGIMVLVLVTNLVETVAPFHGFYWLLLVTQALIAARQTPPEQAE